MSSVCKEMAMEGMRESQKTKESKGCTKPKAA